MYIPKRILTPTDVAGIHYASAEGASDAALAVLYGVSRVQIWRVRTGVQHPGSSSLRSNSPASTRVNDDANWAIVEMLKARGLA